MVKICSPNIINKPAVVTSQPLTRLTWQQVRWWDESNTTTQVRRDGNSSRLRTTTDITNVDKVSK